MSASVPASWLTPTSGVTPTSYLGIEWGHVALAILLCVGLGVIAILLLKKRLPNGVAAGIGAASARRIRIVEHARLAPRTTLHLVEYDHRVVMLVSDTSGVKLLDAHDRPAPEQ